MISKIRVCGAGAVVTKNVPDYAMVYGSPPESVAMCASAVKLHFSEGRAVCAACGKKYDMNENSEVKEIL